MKISIYFTRLVSVLLLAFIFAACDKSVEVVEPVVSLDSGLVYHFPFDGNSIDQVSQNSYDLTGTTFAKDRHNSANKALKMEECELFEGVRINAGLGTGEGALSFWINLDDLKKIHPLFICGFFHNIGPLNYNIYIRTDSTLVVAWPNTSSDDYQVTPKVIKTKQWQHIVIRWANEQSTLDVFVSGNKVLSTDYQSDDPENPYDDPESMGRSQSNNGSHNYTYNYFRGKMDELRRYNRWLSDEEVLALGQ